MMSLVVNTTKSLKAEGAIKRNDKK